MRQRRLVMAAMVCGIMVCFSIAGSAEARGQRWCNGFGYGNAGYASGYSTFVTRRVGWCGRGWGSGYGYGYGYGPRWACRPRLCSPCYPGWGGGWAGWPGCGFGGWYGSSMYSGVQSVYLATPAGGGATFFSGGIVPFPVPYGVPYAVPFPVAVPTPWFGGTSGTAAAAAVAVASPRPAERRGPLARQVLPRPRPVVAAATTAIARRRAAVLMAAGDQDLIASGAAPDKLAAAASAYARAAKAAQDDPDIHVRHALALVALGRQAEADAAAARAVAIDGRLAYRPGEQAVDRPSPLVERGLAILRDLGRDRGEQARDTIALVADRWAGQAASGLAALAASDAAIR